MSHRQRHDEVYGAVLRLPCSHWISRKIAQHCAYVAREQLRDLHVRKSSHCCASSCHGAHQSGMLSRWVLLQSSFTYTKSG